MTTETKQIDNIEEYTRKVWIELWRFAQQSVAYQEGSIDQDDFIKYGQELFDVKHKVDGE